MISRFSYKNNFNTYPLLESTSFNHVPVSPYTLPPTSPKSDMLPWKDQFSVIFDNLISVLFYFIYHI